MLRPAGWRIFEILLAPVWRCIEQRARIAVWLGATRIGRVSMEHLVANPEEHAQPMLLAEQIIRAVMGFVLCPAAIIIFRRTNPRIVRDMEVVIEVRAEGRIPRDIPSSLLPVGLKLRKRRA